MNPIHLDILCKETQNFGLTIQNRLGTQYCIIRTDHLSFYFEKPPVHFTVNFVLVERSCIFYKIPYPQFRLKSQYDPILCINEDLSRTHLHKSPKRSGGGLVKHSTISETVFDLLLT